MKKIIFLLSLLSCQAMAYQNNISKEYPLDKNDVIESPYEKEISVVDSFKYNENLKFIYDKLSTEQKSEFLDYLNLYRKSINNLLKISDDKRLLVANDVLENKITIDKVYLDYVFYKSYPQFIKSYFTIQSIIKSDNDKLFKQNIENVKKMAERNNKVDSYMSHMEEVKGKILHFVNDGKTMKDVDLYIKNSFNEEREKFMNSIDKNEINVTYNYIQYEINQYRNNNDLPIKEKNWHLDYLNNKGKEWY